MRDWITAIGLAVATAATVGCGSVTVEEGPPTDANLTNCVETTVTDCAATEPWRCEPPLPTTLQEMPAAVMGGRIYLPGGFESLAAIVPTVRVYDPATQQWCEAPPLPAPRHHVAVAAVGNDLYVLGGMQDFGFTPLDTAWVLRAGATEWEPIAPLPAPRASGAAGVIDGKIYLAGGETGGEGCVLAEPVHIYDPATGEWEDDGPVIPTPREHVAGAVHDGELYVFGGRLCSLASNQTAVEAFNPSTEQWRTLPDMPESSGGLSAAVLDGVAYVSGGEFAGADPGGAYDYFFAFDLTEGEWQEPGPPPLPTQRHGHASATIDGRVFVLAGADERLFGAVDVVESYAP